MEDILDIYKRPYEPEYPVVCFDESSKQLVAEIIEPLSMEPVKPQRYDYQYESNGLTKFVHEGVTPLFQHSGGVKNSCQSYTNIGKHRFPHACQSKNTQSNEDAFNNQGEDDILPNN